MSKKKEKTMMIETREGLELTMNVFAIRAAEFKSITAKMDVEIGSVREKYTAALTQIADDMKPLADALEEWAELHPEAFAEKKSLELVAGKIGYRCSPPAVKTLPKVKEESAIRLIEAEECYREKYIRMLAELDREAILASYACKEVCDETLKRLGLRVVQTETFYIDPAETKAEAK